MLARRERSGRDRVFSTRDSFQVHGYKRRWHDDPSTVGGFSCGSVDGSVG